MRIKQENQFELVIQKSRFIAYASPIQDEQSVKTYLQDLRKMHKNANHFCYAYVLEENIQKSSDDGEPSSTAGVPILQAILEQHLQQTFVCVVRYFGGIKLGASGLIRSYHQAAKQALQSAIKVEDQCVFHFQLAYPFSLTGKLDYFLRQNTIILDTTYTQHVTTNFYASTMDIISQIQNLTSGQCTPTYLEQTTIEVEVSEEPSKD